MTRIFRFPVTQLFDSGVLLLCIYRLLMQEQTVRQIRVCNVQWKILCIWLTLKSFVNQDTRQQYFRTQTLKPLKNLNSHFWPVSAPVIYVTYFEYISVFLYTMWILDAIVLYGDCIHGALQRLILTPYILARIFTCIFSTLYYICSCV